MKLTIDYDEKTIEIHGYVLGRELLEFLTTHYEFHDYTLSGVTGHFPVIDYNPTTTT